MSGRQNRIGGSVGLEIDALWAALDSQKLLCGVNQRLRQTDRGVYLEVQTCCDEIALGGEVATGSCCDAASGACTVTSAEGCLAGVFTAGAVCEPNPCAQPPPPPVDELWRCCRVVDNCHLPPPGCFTPDCGTVCELKTAAECAAIAGAFYVGQLCADGIGTPCDLGACCLGGSCSMTTAAGCAGVFHAGRACVGGCAVDCSLPPPPPAVGRCCLPSGACSISEEGACLVSGGAWVEGGDCVSPCPQPPATGACCIAATGACSEGTQAACDVLGGTWTQGGACQPNPCPQPPPVGRCCRLDGGNCQNETEAQCLANAGVWFWYADGNCQAGPACPTMGACCDGLGGCFQSVFGDCPPAPGGQSRWNAFLECGALPNCDLGCCNTGGVTATTLQAECAFPGNWTAGACAPAAPTGACCLSGVCTDSQTEAACVAQAGATWQGAGTTCAGVTCPQPPAPTGKCCSGMICVGDGMTQAACDFYYGQWYQGQSCNGGMC